MFSIKRLRVSFQLINTVFTYEGEEYDTFVIDDAAVQATISETASGQATLNITVYGLSNDVINRLTVTKGDPTKLVNWVNNKIQLDLLDKDGNAEMLFLGQIAVGVADYNAAPDVPMQIVAHTWYEAAMYPLSPQSFPGVATVDQILRTIAQQIGYNFVNYGVNTTLTDESLNGDAWTMITEVCKHADIDFILTRNTLKIAPKGKTDLIDPLPVSRYSGMVGYPKVIDDGIMVTCSFKSDYTVLRQVKLEVKEIDAANGSFVIRGLEHSIDTQTPSGKWYSDLALSYFLEDLNVRNS